MISIIIASVNPQLKKQITENIAKTIGCNYELLITDNSKNPRGLCKLYNLSAGEAKYPYLIFVHEDIIFHTHNWGKILIESLNLPLIGLVGSAGTTYKSKQLSSWIDVPSYLYRSNIIQTDTAKPTTRIRNNNSHTSQVSILDGMLLAIKKTTWEKYNFDEIHFNGFHLYDHDISMQIGRNKKIIVTHDILIEHFSSGNYSEKWFHDLKTFHKKWRKQLPITSENLSLKKTRRIEHSVAIKSIFHLLKFEHRFAKISRGLFMIFYYRPFSPYNFHVIWRILKKKLSTKIK